MFDATDNYFANALMDELLPTDKTCLVMLSGGSDSVALTDLVVRAAGPANVHALHVNYGLRSDADGDEESCVRLANRLGIRLHVEQAAGKLPEGNLQAAARRLRYDFAEQCRVREGLDWIAVGHTASDQIETVLYRLASSPGRRALLGMSGRSGRIVRPLLGVTRDQVRDYCRERGLTWRDDESNDDQQFARARVRGPLLDALRAVHPAAEANLLATAAVLRDEAEVLDHLVSDVLTRELDEGSTISGAVLKAMPEALARLVVRELAERAGDGPVSLTPSQVKAILGLTGGGGSGSLDLGGGVKAVAEYGRLRFVGPVAGGPKQSVDPVELLVPGTVCFGDWVITAEVGDSGVVDDGARTILVRADGIGSSLTVRPREPGDRIAQVGMSGNKKLQDLFVDSKLAEAQRARYPVICSGDKLVWVPGLAVSRDYVADAVSVPVVHISAHRPN